MPIHLLGGGFGEAPFSRTFFNVALGEILSKAGKDKEQRLTLYLTDGTLLDVCEIEELADAHLTLRAFRKDDDACDLGVHLIPYALIYRIEITPKSAEDSNRVGFHWAPPAMRRGTSRRTAR
jgi:hypothetical protein